MALQAFEASVRHLSFTAAARELCLTQGAVSRQIKLLEERLGLPLFERRHNRLALTEAGRVFLDDVLAGLGRVDDAVMRVKNLQAQHNGLNLAVGPAFGARWLMPRFPAFVKRHPEATINVFSRVDPVDFTREVFDAAVHYGPSLQRGLLGDWLLAEDAVPVCSPEFADAGLLRGHPEQLASSPLLHLSARLGGWADWSEATRQTLPNASTGQRFEQLFVLIEAARAGLGVALAPRYAVASEIERGDLIIPFDVPVASPWGYWLVYPESKSSHPTLQPFRDWLLREAGHSSANA